MLTTCMIKPMLDCKVENHSAFLQRDNTPRLFAEAELL